MYQSMPCFWKQCVFHYELKMSWQSEHLPCYRDLEPSFVYLVGSSRHVASVSSGFMVGRSCIETDLVDYDERWTQHALKCTKPISSCRTICAVCPLLRNLPSGVKCQHFDRLQTSNGWHERKQRSLWMHYIRNMSGFLNDLKPDTSNLN